MDYALFISFFPHLIAGPIQRPSHLLPQIEADRRFDATKFFDGIMLIITGLFRKCVVADNCALLADAAFGGPLGAPSLAVLAIGIYAFAWQIYGDFSGYSDIARGSAQLLGFHFMVNFRQPYLSRPACRSSGAAGTSASARGCAITCIFRSAAIATGEPKTYRNLMLTMLMGGLWHGANWTFVVWGGIHGVGLAVERAIFGRKGKTEGAAERLLALTGRVGAADLYVSPGVPELDLLPRSVDERCVSAAWRIEALGVAAGIRHGIPSGGGLFYVDVSGGHDLGDSPGRVSFRESSSTVSTGGNRHEPDISGDVVFGE